MKKSKKYNKEKHDKEKGKEKFEEKMKEKKLELDEEKEKEKNNIINNNNENDLLDDNYFIRNIKNKYKEYWDEPLNVNFEICNQNNIGKLIVKQKNIVKSEIFDYNDIIVDYHYNRRLNMFATTSCDGFICVYMLPCKLIAMIKNPNNSYYSRVLLSSNPFPLIIAFDEKEKKLTSYSLSGIMINEITISNNKNEELKIEPIFNKYG